MSAEVETFVQLKSPEWQTQLPEVESLCQIAATAAWRKALDREGAFEVAIVLADDALVQELNREYRSQDKPTNVLSFPTDRDEPVLPGDVPTLGDIIIAFETTKSEAPDNLPNHLSHLVVHGCLHLLGFDHENDKEAAEMEGLETQILAGLGIADPYKEASNS
jgi:probable rRNA maturation factor